MYCEMRVVDLDEPESIEYERIATIGSQQLQARMVTSYWFEHGLYQEQYRAVGHGVKKG